MRVELDRRSIFALASDTRMEILKSLQPMRRTVTQLAESVGIDKAAVHRHLKKLEEGELVKRHDDHGFVYYGLSWKARDLLAPNDNTKIVILLSTALVLAIGALLAIVLAQGTINPGFPGAPSGPSAPSAESRGGGQPGTSPLWFIPGLLLAVSASLLLASALRRLLRPKQKLHPNESSPNGSA